MGVLDELDLDTALRTGVVRSGDDLVLVAERPHPHLEGTALARRAAMLVRAAGITEVGGDLVIDESRFDAARTAPGWQDWQMPAYVGPLSALTVDDNRGRSDAAFLAEPALGHGETFRDLLGTVGVRVVGSVTRRTAPQGAVPVAGLDSPPLGELLARMLQSSDNEVAESLARGRSGAGRGSHPDRHRRALGRAAGRLRADRADGWAAGRD